MAHSRGPVIAWSASVATISGGFAAFVWANVKSPLDNLLFELLAFVAGAAFVFLIAAGIPDLTSWLNSEWEARRPPPRLQIDSWEYTADGKRAEVRELAHSMYVDLPGTGFMADAQVRPPSVRLAVLVGSTAISPDSDVGESARDGFEAFLKHEVFMTLVKSLTCVAEDENWVRWASSYDWDWVLGSDPDSDGVASARLILPWGVKPDWHEGQYAMLLLHVTPRDDHGATAPPASPETWANRIDTALELLPALLTVFLRDQMGAHVAGAPPAVVAISLAARELTELVDVTGMPTLPGGKTMSEAWGFFIGGTPYSMKPWRAAKRMTAHMLRYALGIDIRLPKLPWWH